MCIRDRLRIARLRLLTVAALVLWGLLALYALVENLAPGFWTVTALCLLAVYFLAVGLLRRQTFKMFAKAVELSAFPSNAGRGDR